MHLIYCLNIKIFFLYFHILVKVQFLVSCKPLATENKQNPEIESKLNTSCNEPKKKLHLKIKIHINIKSLQKRICKKKTPPHKNTKKKKNQIDWKKEENTKFQWKILSLSKKYTKKKIIEMTMSIEKEQKIFLKFCSSSPPFTPFTHSNFASHRRLLV